MGNLTRYSKEYAGDGRNYNWSVSVSVCDGYVTILQDRIGSDDPPLESVLLSPSQWRAVKDFVARRRK